MSESFSTALQGLANGDPWIQLFTVDAIVLGGGLYNFTPGPLGNADVGFNGVTYTPIPIQAQDFEWNGQGPLPTPKLRIANIFLLPMQLVIQFGDLLGATVTRQRTFLSFLDGKANGGTGGATLPDVPRVYRKSHADKNFVEVGFVRQGCVARVLGAVIQWHQYGGGPKVNHILSAVTIIVLLGGFLLLVRLAMSLFGSKPLFGASPEADQRRTPDGSRNRVRRDRMP